MTKLNQIVENKFGSPKMFLVENEKRTSKPAIFRTNGINFSNYDLQRKIKLPKKLTPLLAEEIGIHIGDGFLARNKYDFRVKGDKINEVEYYKRVIAPMYKKLFNIKLNLQEYENTFGFEFYSKALWEFKTRILDIPTSPKRNIHVPDVVKNGSTQIICAFLRGYFDTDGCLSFKTQYGRQRYYPVICATSRSEFLAKEVYSLLQNLGLRPNLYKSKSGYWDIVLNGYENLRLFKKLVGWRNPKNVEKFKKWEKDFKTLRMAAVVQRSG